MKNHPRIAIGVPHAGVMTSHYFFSMMGLSLYEGSKRSEKDEEDITKVSHLGSIYESAGCYVGMNRSIICDKFLSEPQNSHLLMIDTDISFNHNLLDIITAHIDAFPQAGIIAGRVNLGNGYPVFYMEGYGTQVMQVQPFHGIQHFDLVGTGIIIISRAVLEEMVKHFGTFIFAHIIKPVPEQDNKLKEYGDDFSFCLRARELHIPVFGAWGIYGQHWKTSPVPMNYPDQIINLAPMARKDGKG